MHSLGGNSLFWLVYMRSSSSPLLPSRYPSRYPSSCLHELIVLP